MTDKFFSFQAKRVKIVIYIDKSRLKKTNGVERSHEMSKMLP